MKNVSISSVALGLLLFLVASAHAATEYLDLQATNDEMAPAIRSGDTIRVKICANGSLIKAGPLTSTNPGDIIVYCAIVIAPNPNAMWACGRAVSKCLRNGEWHFKTQVDNSSEPDPWEVPEHFLLGVVVDVVHATHSPNTASEVDSQSGQGAFVFDLLVGVFFGVAIGFGAEESLSKFSDSHFSLSRSFS